MIVYKIGATVYEHRRFLLALFIISFVVRALLFSFFTHHGTNAWIYVDSEQYLSIASNLIQGHGICFDVGSPHYYRLPGYPIFLAACYKTGLDIFGALWVQIFLASFIPLLVFLLSLVIFQTRLLLARLAGIISCVHLGFMLYAGMIATESLSVLFLLLFFILFYFQLQIESSKIVPLCGAGLALGAASMIRPVGHYVLVVALVMIAFAHKKTASKLLQGALLIAGWLVAVTPWLVRNFMLTGSVFFHSLPGLHFVQYTATNIVMQRDNSSYPQARAKVLEVWNNQITQIEQNTGHTLNDYQRCCLGESLTLSYIKQYPLYACKHAVIEMFKTCAGLYAAIILLADGAQWPNYGPQVTSWQKVQRFIFPAVKRPFLAVLIYSEIIMMALMVLGLGIFLLLTLSDASARMGALLMMPYVILFIGITLAYGGARLRMPADPFLIIAALYGWLYGWLGFLQARAKGAKT